MNDEQRPPYEDVEPAVTRALPRVVNSASPAPVRAVKPVPSAASPTAPEPPTALPTWTEARILRLTSILVATAFVVGFVITASLACPPWLAWAPFLIGALPFLGYAYLSLNAHLRDESRSRERHETWQHSRLDLQPLGDMDASTERYR